MARTTSAEELTDMLSFGLETDEFSLINTIIRGRVMLLYSEYQRVIS